ncbi:MAG: hypothetical protein JSS82_04525 [Bacteroidetes bacterium]|nr:hypothetical protein [Bacteroidota bacterium]
MLRSKSGVWRVALSVAVLVCCGFRGYAQKDAVMDAGEATPMSCRTEGQIVRILKAGDPDKKNLCSKHACRALVKIISVDACGAGVSLRYNSGDVVEMYFAYSLSNTRKLFPNMKVVYPGLKKGQHFTARIEQRLRPGSDGVFVVYGYRRR